jgi:hypothetical protein
LPEQVLGAGRNLAVFWGPRQLYDHIKISKRVALAPKRFPEDALDPITIAGVTQRALAYNESKASVGLAIEVTPDGQKTQRTRSKPDGG